MIVLVENSTWNNVGDGFYQTSLFRTMQELLPDGRVATMDGPIDRAFSPSSSLKAHALDVRTRLEGDLFVFSGPILGPGFLDRYGQLIRSIVGRGSNYMLLSVHGHHHATATEGIRELLRTHPPAGFSSRTSETFETYGTVVDDPYNGICSAFFLPMNTPYPSVEETAPPGYIAVSTYSRPEPAIAFELEPDGSIDLATVQVSGPSAKLWRLARHFEWMKNKPAEINGYEVVRPVHDISYKFSHLNFGHANSYLSHNPVHYYTLYSGSSLTISDRVHACVAALSAGRPAVLVGSWDRAGLFSRLDLDVVDGCMLPPSREVLESEYSQFKCWLRRRLGGLVDPDRGVGSSSSQ